MRILFTPNDCSQIYNYRSESILIGQFHHTKYVKAFFPIGIWKAFLIAFDLVGAESVERVIPTLRVLL